MPEKPLKTSLNISVMGPLPSRYLPTGYHPEFADETTADRVRRAVDGLGDVIDGYEFYYPQVLSEENVEAVAEALGGHDFYAIASGLHLDRRFANGGLVATDASTREDALRSTLATADFAGALKAHLIVWPGVEGYNYPFQTPYDESWAWLIDGLGQVAERCATHGITLLLEPKGAAPAMQIFLRNVGTTLFVVEKLRARGLDNVKINMDWQHLVMNGENLAECAALLAMEGVLGHQHANAGWGTLDDKTVVGTGGFMRTLELAVELRRVGYGNHGERIGFDFYPYTEDAIAAIRQGVRQWRFIDEVASRIDPGRLRDARSRKDALQAYQLVYTALGADCGRSDFE
jgi:xylose isomerase